MQILNEQYSFNEYLLGNYYMLWNTAGVKTDKNLPDLMKLMQSMLNYVVTIVGNEAEQDNSVWFVEMGEV